MKRAISATIIFFIIIMLLPLSVSAAEGVELPSEYDGIADSLPDVVKSLLPQEMLDSKTAGEGLENVLNLESAVNILGRLIGDGLPAALRLLCTLMGILVLSALIRSLAASAKSSALSGGFEVCASLSVFATVISAEAMHLAQSAELLRDLNSLMSSLVPITATVWAMGGNTGTASLSGATLYGFLAISERLCLDTVTPVCLVLTATSLCGAISPDVKLYGISGAVKKTYNFIIGLVMSLLVAILGMQTTLASAADGIAAKTAKMVTSTVIPTVGGSIGDTLRSVAASVSYIKSVFGISSVIFILLLAAPTLITVLLARAVFIISGGIADMLGCERESRLLSQMSDVYGCIMGAVAMSTVMFILGLGIFTKSTVAIA